MTLFLLPFSLPTADQNYPFFLSKILFSSSLFLPLSLPSSLAQLSASATSRARPASARSAGGDPVAPDLAKCVSAQPEPPQTRALSPAGALPDAAPFEPQRAYPEPPCANLAFAHLSPSSTRRRPAQL